MPPVIGLLIETPILQLVVVSALGYVLGQIRVAGSSLGVSAVLFAGLAVGALDPALQMPEFTITLGLVLFVYTIGLSSGPGFFASFRRKGLRDNALALGVLLLGGAVTLAMARLLGLAPAVAAGVFAGSLTNTPALAGVLEYVATYVPAASATSVADLAVVGYSIAYPMGVVGMIAAVALLQRLWQIDYADEARRLHLLEAGAEPVAGRTVRVTRAEATAAPLADWARAHGVDVLVGRIQSGADASASQRLAQPADRVAVGDLVSLVGTADALDAATAYLGEEADERLDESRTSYDYRRIFVSHPRAVGKRLATLGLYARFGALVTRVRRGDVEWVAHPTTVLEPGDRVRVVARPEVMPQVSAFFGDSYRALSEINLLPFSLGLTAGLLLGMIPVPLPGGLVFKLGMAGGPLVAGLVLGTLGRTGRIVWHLPYSGNLLLRQFGLVLFFAGVGTRSGYAFVSTLAQTGGLALFAAGAAVTCTVALATLWAGHRLLKIPMGLLVGMLAGIQTQPAVLGYVLEQTGNDLPNLGYATVFPLATITKILLAQVLLAVLL